MGGLQRSSPDYHWRVRRVTGIQYCTTTPKSQGADERDRESRRTQPANHGPVQNPAAARGEIFQIAEQIVDLPIRRECPTYGCHDSAQATVGALVRADGWPRGFSESSSKMGERV
jgi:hypothetical protein